MFLRSLLAALLASAAIAVVAAPAAQANKTQESIFQDDTVLLTGTPGPALDQLKGLGVNTIHTLVFWNRFGPNPTSKSRPSGDLSNPNSYAATAWAPYDALVKEATARGIGILMTPTGFTPRWAEQCKTVGKFRNCDPNPKDYGKFVTAVARRYSGTFVVDGAALPRVKRWSLWNEPDQTGWIAPQASKGVETSPQIYRNLVYSGLAALRATGHATDQVLLGELAPAHRGTSTDPTSFLLNLFCIDAKGHKLTGKARTQQGCQHFKRFDRHQRLRPSPVEPGRGRAGAEEAALQGRHLALQHRGAAEDPQARRPRASDPVRPADLLHRVRHPDEPAGARPDHTGAAGGVDQPDGLPDLAEQGREERGAVRARGRRDPEPAGLQHRADPERTGTAKPSLDAYRLPIWVVKARDERHALGLGQAGERHAAAGPIQHNTGAGFTTVATRFTDAHGFIDVSQAGSSGTWRSAGPRRSPPRPRRARCRPRISAARRSRRRSRERKYGSREVRNRDGLRTSVLRTP